MIKIYNDVGVSQESIAHCLYSLKLHVPEGYMLGYISALEIIEKNGLEGTRLFILPGGRDLCYMESLQGKGNQCIQDYVAAGGNFLGICAGSYYSGTYVIFAQATPIEVIGPRPLGLFQGIVKGPILAPYYYGSHKGASAAVVATLYSKDAKDCYVYYNGGGYFVDAENRADTAVIASYTNGKAAIIKCNYGLGNVVLSAVHLEYDPDIMQKQSLNLIRNRLKQHNAERVKLFKHILSLLSIA